VVAKAGLTVINFPSINNQSNSQNGEYKNDHSEMQYYKKERYFFFLNSVIQSLLLDLPVEGGIQSLYLEIL